MDRLDHHDRVVDEKSDPRRQSAQRHHVEGQPRGLHHDERDRDRARHHDCRDQRAQRTHREGQHHQHRQREAEHDRVAHALERLGDQRRLIVRNRKLNVRIALAKLRQDLPRLGRDRLSAAARPPRDSHQHRRTVLGRRADVVFPDSKFDRSHIADAHRLAAGRRERHRGNLAAFMQVGGNHRQQHPMRLVHPAGRRDHIVLGQPRDDVAWRQVMLQHPRRIEPHDELAIFAADHADAVGAVDSMEARNEIVVHEVGDFRQAANLRAQADIDDRKCPGRQQHGVNGGIGRQLRARVRDRRAQHLEADLRIGVFAEGDVDLGAAARRRRADDRHADHAVRAFLERPRHRRQHLFGRQVAAVGENRRAAKSDLGKDRARNCARQDHAQHARRQHRQHRQGGAAARH